MYRWNRWPGRRLIALVAVSWLALSLSQAASESANLPQIGPAPAFSYLGVRFDPEVLLRDLQALVQEETRS